MTIRKQPNMYTDVSAIHYRPWRMWQAIVTARSTACSTSCFSGSDYPSGKPSDVIAGLKAVNDLVEGTKFPRVTDETIDGIIHRNHAAVLPRVDLTG